MKYLILLLSVFCINCSDILGPESGGMNVTFPVTYVEWEALHPQDTTWWSFTADGELFVAWKRKLTEVSGAPPWTPHCITYDRYGNCVPRINSSGDTIGTDGRTHAEYLRFWAAQIAGWLPIQYYKGTWGSQDGILLTLAVNRVVPGSYDGTACDMDNVVWVESQYSPQYINYDFWNTDSLFGFLCDENGERITVQHSEPNVKFSRWRGKGLWDKTNSIFRQF